MLLTSLKNVLLLLLFGNLYECANILFVVPFTSKSHYIFLKPIGLELARRGHNVTVIAGYLHDDPPPNYHQIEIIKTELWDVMGVERPNVFTMSKLLSEEEFHDKLLWKGGLAFTEIILKTKNMQNFLKSDNKYDLVIVEQAYTEALYAFAHKYNAPLVIVTAYGNCMRHSILTNQPLQFSTLKNEFIVLKDFPSFWGRFRNFYFSIYEYFWYRYYYMVKQEELALKYVPDLPNPMPPLHEIQSNYSVMLINRHFTLEPPVALLPNMVEIGGAHLEYTTKLPEDFQRLLDESRNGFVYMSLGSNVRSTELPQEKVSAFLNVFRKLTNYTILWKWENANLENKPDNVVIRQWIPQNEVLGHPNIKAFISHGGLMSTEEATYNGVPIVGVPVYCDQYNNLLYTQDAGFGRILEYDDITQDNVERILNDVLNNEDYMKKANEASARYRDRVMTPLNTSIFWIEYVIRNKGARFIKNPGLKMSWLAYSMLDVYAFIALIIGTIVYFIRCFCRYLIFHMYKNPSKCEKIE